MQSHRWDGSYEVVGVDWRRRGVELVQPHPVRQIGAELAQDAAHSPKDEVAFAAVAGATAISEDEMAVARLKQRCMMTEVLGGM